MPPEMMRSTRRPLSNAASMTHRVSMLPAEKKRDGDCDQPRSDQPQRNDRPEQLTPAALGVEREAFRMQHDTLLGPFTHEFSGVLHQLRQSVDQLYEDL